LAGELGFEIVRGPLAEALHHFVRANGFGCVDTDEAHGSVSAVIVNADSVAVGDGEDGVEFRDGLSILKPFVLKKYCANC